MKHMPKRTIVPILCTMILLAQTVAFAQDATLTNIIVTNTQTDLLLYLTVKDAFPPKIKETINSGVPTTFSFFINLYRVRRFWPDKQIASIKLTHTIKYDNLKKDYIITRSWQDSKPATVRSFDEAKKLMAEVDSLTIVQLNKLKKGEQYQIRTKAELNKLTLPLYLHYVLFFLSLWDFETDWYTIDFIY